jgi:hypothetical protein
VRHRSASQYDATVTTTLTIGTGSGTFASRTVRFDTTPAPFAFADALDVARGALVTSAAVTVTGINQPTPIEVANGAYSIGAAAFTTAPGTVRDGQTVRVQHTAASTFSTTVSTTLTIGGVTGAFKTTTLARDTAPDPFAFQGQANLPPSTTAVANEVTISGINDPAPIAVSGGQYSINGGPYTYSAGNVASGQKVRVRHTTSSAFSGTMKTVLNVGGVQGTFTTTTQARDTTPEPFAFAATTGVARSAPVVSNEITVAGINDATPVGIGGGSYSINGGAFTTAAGTVTNGQRLRVQHTSAAAFEASRQTVLTIGGVMGSFTSTTEVEDTKPDAFSFTDQSGALPLAETTSNTITVGGINSASAVSIAGGSYSVNGGAFTTASGTVGAGDTLTLNVTAGPVPTSAVNVTLTVGGVSDTWTVQTLP